MKRIIFFLLAIMFSLAPYAQKTVHKKPVKKIAVANRKHQAQRKPAARRPKAPTKAERRAATYSNASIRGLQGQRADIQRRIREQEQALRKNKADVKKRLEDLMALNGEIDQSQKKIEGIEKDIHHINGNIGILQAQLKTLQQQLQDRKNKYIRSMRYMSRHHTVQDKLMFIFSAKNLTQMYRRLSFIRQYSSYQKVQGEAVKAKQQQVNDKHKQLQNVKGHKNTLLYKGKQEKTVLEGKQTQQQEMVHGLQKQQKTIQAVIADQRKFVSALIIPEYGALEKYAQANGISFTSRGDLCSNGKIHQMISERIETLQQQLAHYEQIKRFTLLPKPFTMESGELTNTLKMRRKVINEHYKNEIEKMYAE